MTEKVVSLAERRAALKIAKSSTYGKGGANVRHSSKSPDWCTPPEILEATRRTFQGPIEFDPCTSALAQVHVQADDFWTPEDGADPLVARWDKDDGPHTVTHWRPRSVFLNPPGGRLADHSSSQKAYWFKLAREWVEGRVREAVFLSFSIELLQTSQVQVPCDAGRGYRLPIPLDFPICYFARRVAYYEERDSVLVKGASPPHSSCAVYLPDFRQPRLGAGPYTTQGCKIFRRAFGELGHVVCPL